MNTDELQSGIDEQENQDERYDFSLTLSYGLNMCPYKAQEINDEIICNWPFTEYLMV